MKDGLAVRNLELTRRALAAGEYGEAYLDLDPDLFAKYRAGESDALRSQPWYDPPTWTALMSRVMPGDRVLCLVGGGGQQSAIYSLLGADVTVFDLTPEQLERDHLAARHYGYGIETHPIDLRDGEQYSWLEALIWPEHADRIALLANARKVWLEAQPRVEAGDALELLPFLAAEAPADAALCVFHCHALNQFPAEARESFMRLLTLTAHSRPVFHVASEGERMEVVRMEGDRSTTLLSVSRSAHGRWIQW